MVSRSLPFLVVALSLAALAVSAQDTASDAPRPDSWSLPDPDRDGHGTLTLSGTMDGVIVNMIVKGVTPGWHSMHFDETSVCKDGAPSRTGSQALGAMLPGVGSKAPTEFSELLLPDIYIGEEGLGYVEVPTSNLTRTLGYGVAYLVDDDGLALVIHAKLDGYRSQPVSGFNGRYLCGPMG